MAILFVFASLIFVLGTSFADESAVAIQVTSTQTPDPRLFGLNDVLGPIVTIPYSDPALCEAVKALRVGVLRHPGGTVANYWNITSGDYVQPCNRCACCKFQPSIDKFPKQAFAAKSFDKYLKPCTLSEVFVFDINLLTMSTAETIVSLQRASDIGVDVTLLELGNEFYLHEPYSWKFPNASSYMEAALPVIRAARQLWPRARIAAVTKSEFGEVQSEWNSAVSTYRAYFDDVTVHEYSIGEKTLAQFPESIWWGAPSALADADLQDITAYVHRTFGADKRVWNTEYNFAIKDPGSFITAGFDGALRGSLILSRILSAQAMYPEVTTTMYHAFGAQKDVGWDSRAGMVELPNLLNHTHPGTYRVSGPAQLYAHASHIANERANRMHGATVQNNPTWHTNTRGKTMGCLQVGVYSRVSDTLSTAQRGAGAGAWSDDDSNGISSDDTTSDSLADADRWTSGVLSTTPGQALADKDQVLQPGTYEDTGSPDDTSGSPTSDSWSDDSLWAEGRAEAGQASTWLENAGDFVEYDRMQPVMDDTEGGDVGGTAGGSKDGGLSGSVNGEVSQRSEDILVCDDSDPVWDEEFGAPASASTRGSPSDGSSKSTETHPMPDRPIVQALGSASTEWYVIAINRCAQPLQATVRLPAGEPGVGLGAGAPSGWSQVSYNLTDAGGWAPLPSHNASFPWSGPLRSDVRHGDVSAVMLKQGLLPLAVDGLSISITTYG